jgi:hypothetical protein
MALKMGPVLKFRGGDESGWRLSALIVADSPPGNLTVDPAGTALTVFPVMLWRVGTQIAFRYQFAVPLAATATSLRYQVDGRDYEFAVPAQGQPPCIAYASCNGFSSVKVMKGVKNKNGLWSRMASRHTVRPYHLLLLGGDQVYADSMWEKPGEMKTWYELDWDAANGQPPTPLMKTELEKFYFDLYTQRWAQPEVAQMLATIPTVMMWDDHDIIDGWGSYPEERQKCEVFEALWDAARKAFTVFQQQLEFTDPKGNIAPARGFTFGYVVANTAILALDMRSERTDKTVMSENHWTLAYQWLDGLAEIDHLILMSSIPVVYPGFDTIERILGMFPGQQELEDDLRDHWNSRPHKGERLRLIHRLLKMASAKKIRPTIVSGDVHVGALGLIESARSEPDGSLDTVINQLISSGIVHPGPPGVMLFALRHLFDSEDEVDRGIVARMIDFPGTQHRFIGQRNFLSLEPDDKPAAARIWANWIVEGEEDPYVKVIHSMR